MSLVGHFSFMQTSRVTNIVEVFAVFFSLLSQCVLCVGSHEPSTGSCFLEITGLINCDFKTRAD